LSRGGGKRRYRIRRKRRRDGPVADIVGEAAIDGGLEAGFEVAGAAAEAVGGLDTEVVGTFGCCVVEAVCAASVLAALLLVPTYLVLS
jgi:hypothetical protein